MSLWDKIKHKAKEELQKRQERTAAIRTMTDKELKQKAVREGGVYADEYVRRRKAHKELDRRVKG